MASDDIVTRLRQMATLRQPITGQIIADLCTDAADELDRLTNELATVKAERDIWERELYRE